MNRFATIVILLLLISACSSNHQSGATRTPQSGGNEETTTSPSNKPETVAPLNFQDLERTSWQNPSLVLSKLGNLENKVVVDIGAGAGYFTFKIAQLAKKVIALDVDPRALEYIEEQKSIVGEWSENIETRLTPPDVPNLLSDEADVVLIVNTYYFIPKRPRYLPRLLQGMVKKGKIIIVDYKRGDIPVGPSDVYKLDPQTIIRELRKAGFKKVRSDIKSLNYQYIITAEKP